MKKLVPLFFLMIMAFTIASQRYRQSYEYDLEVRAKAALEEAAKKHPELLAVSARADHLYLYLQGKVTDPSVKSLADRLVSGQSEWKVINEIEVVSTLLPPEPVEASAPPVMDMAQVEPAPPEGVDKVEPSLRNPATPGLPAAGKSDVEEPRVVRLSPPSEDAGPPAITKAPETTESPTVSEESPTSPAAGKSDAEEPKVVRLSPPSEDAGPPAITKAPETTESPTVSEESPTPPAAGKSDAEEPRVVRLSPPSEDAGPPAITTAPTASESPSVPEVALPVTENAAKEPKVVRLNPLSDGSPPAVTKEPDTSEPPTVAEESPAKPQRSRIVDEEDPEPARDDSPEVVEGVSERIPFDLPGEKPIEQVLEDAVVKFDREQPAISDAQDRAMMNLAIELLMRGTTRPVLITSRYRAEGDVEAQKEISVRRAESVKLVLTQYGVSESILKLEAKPEPGWKKHEVEFSFVP